MPDKMGDTPEGGTPGRVSPHLARRPSAGGRGLRQTAREVLNATNLSAEERGFFEQLAADDHTAALEALASRLSPEPDAIADAIAALRELKLSPTQLRLLQRVRAYVQHGLAGLPPEEQAGS